MRDPLLEAVGLVRRFVQGGREVTVLDGVDVTVEAGEILMVTGRSGSGKSTLLNLVSGLDLPQAGHVRLNLPGGAVRLTEVSERHRTAVRRRHMGFVFQLFNLIPTLTALENVALVAELNGMEHPEARAQHRLAALGLGRRMEAFPETLSGGEQQRVAIARALVHEPSLLLADEPAGNLDRETGDLVFERLLASVRDARTALVMVTHDRELAAAGDRRLELAMRQEGRPAGNRPAGARAPRAVEDAAR